MSAYQLIDGASFGPDSFKVLGQAFDAAWSEIAGGMSTDPAAIEAARLTLANAILSVAKQNWRDGVEDLKQAALRRVMGGASP
jgi:hypothetical protein